MKDHNEAIDLVIKALIDPDHSVVKSLSEIAAVGAPRPAGGDQFVASQRSTTMSSRNH